jgi:hypothetical protein
MKNAPINAPDTQEEFTAHMKSLFPSASDADILAAWERHSSKSLTERIVETMNDYGENLVLGLQSEFQATLKEQMATQQDAMVEGIRKGLGLESDPTIHLKELDVIVRDLVLKYAGPAKKGGKDDDDDLPPGTKVVKEDPQFDFAARLAKAKESGNGPR